MNPLFLLLPVLFLGLDRAVTNALPLQAHPGQRPLMLTVASLPGLQFVFCFLERVTHLPLLSLYVCSLLPLCV